MCVTLVYVISVYTNKDILMFLVRNGLFSTTAEMKEAAFHSFLVPIKNKPPGIFSASHTSRRDRSSLSGEMRPGFPSVSFT